MECRQVNMLKQREAKNNGHKTLSIKFKMHHNKRDKHFRLSLFIYAKLHN